MVSRKSGRVDSSFADEQLRKQKRNQVSKSRGPQKRAAGGLGERMSSTGHCTLFTSNELVFSVNRVSRSVPQRCQQSRGSTEEVFLISQSIERDVQL